VHRRAVRFFHLDGGDRPNCRSSTCTDEQSALGYTFDVYGVLMKQSRKPSSERTNIVLDSKLVERVKRLAKVKTTRDAVHVALEHYVRSRDYSGVLALRGTGGVSEGYDPKAASPSR